MTSFTELVPAEHQELYLLTYIVELGLRELCIEQLGARYGPRFWREELPDELTAMIRARLAVEQAEEWPHGPLHPLSYLVLPELVQILDSDQLWIDVFRYHFRLRGTLRHWMSQLVAARVTLHANLPPSAAELQAARNAYYELSTGVGDQRLRGWLEQPTRADGRWAILDAVEQELETQEQRWKLGQTLLPFIAWPQLEATWWFDRDYIGAGIDVLTNAMLLLKDYTRLLDAGATAAEAKAWAAECDLSGRAVEAFAELYLIRAALGEN